MEARGDVDEEAWQFEDVAVICTYSLLDNSLLNLSLSSHMLMSSTFSDELVVVRIKSIKSVVGIIPHRLKRPSSIIEDRFFVMEKPGLDISQVGIPYSVYQDEDDQGEDIEQQ